MRVIFTGCREGLAMRDLLDAIDESGFYIHHVIQGGCPDPEDKRKGRSLDMLAKEYAVTLNIPYTQVNADWQRHPRAAGPIRNSHMIQNYRAEGVIAVWNNKSRGTLDCFTKARRAGLPTHVYIPKRYL